VPLHIFTLKANALISSKARNHLLPNPNRQTGVGTCSELGPFQMFSFITEAVQYSTFWDKDSIVASKCETMENFEVSSAVDTCIHISLHNTNSTPEEKKRQ